MCGIFVITNVTWIHDSLGAYLSRQEPNRRCIIASDNIATAHVIIICPHAITCDGIANQCVMCKNSCRGLHVCIHEGVCEHAVIEGLFYNNRPKHTVSAVLVRMSVRAMARSYHPITCLNTSLPRLICATYATLNCFRRVSPLNTDVFTN